MKPDYITEKFLADFIQSSLAEDVGDGDHSSLASVPPKISGKARLHIKEDGIIAGIELAEHIFKSYDPGLTITTTKKDGEQVKRGAIPLEVHGPVRSILTTERLVLNCMQRMSGIATATNRLVKLIEGTRAKILDTRKTTPNFRLLEKWAVLIGGGVNHRIGLFDMIMLKDNHIDISGGIEQAIKRTKEYLRAQNKNLRIEVETRTLEEVEAVLNTGGIDVIMLDNMSLGDVQKAVQRINARFKVEASGGITEDTIQDVANCGVDYISVGALTHSIKSLDMSLKISK